MKNIFVTGCTGYIGSHTCVELLESGYEVIGLDNYSNSKPEVLENITKITGKSIKFYEGNMQDKALLLKIFTENEIAAVIDFAAYKSVGDSVAKPVEYYINNVSSLLMLLDAMQEKDIKTIMFSSSATVYGESKIMPITEKCEIGHTTNPYGTSKLFCEQILNDLYKANNDYNICIFRYFNPVGAHPTGLIGEEPNGIPANLMPFICDVARGKLPCLNVFGDDYDTKDGTGVRDYIHVVDLAKAHISGLKKLETDKKGMHIYNLGTGKGYSVMEMIKAFEKINNIKVKFKVTKRRPGDIAVCYADPTKAYEELGWKAKLGLEDMCKDAYKFIKNKEIVGEKNESISNNTSL